MFPGATSAMAHTCKWLPKSEEEESLVARNEDSSRSSSEFAQPPRPPSRSRWKPSLTTCKDMLLVALATLGLVSLLRPLPGLLLAAHNANPGAAQSPPAKPSCGCGNSTAEALSLNCKYDSLAAAWLPPHCRDDDLTAEFERAGPGEGGRWTYWRDRARTQEISLEELATMGDDRAFRFYMTGRWHLVHCIFYWRKEHRARFSGKMVEARSDNEGHIKHCGRVFLDPDHDTVAGVELDADH